MLFVQVYKITLFTCTCSKEYLLKSLLRDSFQEIFSYLTYFCGTHNIKCTSFYYPSQPSSMTHNLLAVAVKPRRDANISQSFARPPQCLPHVTGDEESAGLTVSNSSSPDTLVTVRPIARHRLRADRHLYAKRDARA